MAKEIVSSGLEYSDIITDPMFDARINRPASIAPKVKSAVKAIIPKIVLGIPSKLACSVFMTEPQLSIGLMLQAGS